MLFLNMRIIPKENITMNILVVDDEQTILTGVEEYLKEYGYNVFTAGNGVEAINIFNNIEINLIVLDLMMPEKNGYEVLEEIRTQSNIPVIILSAMEDEISQLKGFDLEADDYVTKPFSLPLLKFLLKHSNQVMSREQILDYVWNNSDDVPYDRVIDVYIKNLRKKLELDCIVTVKNVGYKLQL